MAVALVALPTMAQNFGAQNAEEQLQTQVFQSTSTMTPVGSAYSANPSISADGTAYTPSAQAQSGPRRTAASPGSPTTPGAGSEENQFPVGDAVLPLALMALAFAGVIYLRRRKRA